ncbi:MAG: choice-of-anchor Q domain-containing protein, partial [Gaiellales bacterium]
VANGDAIRVLRSSFADNDGWNYGGAISAETSGSSTLDHVTFARNRNTADSGGGAVYIDSRPDDTADLTVTNTTFTGNVSAYGSALNVEDLRDVTIERTVFTGNRGTEGVFAVGPRVDATIRQSAIVANESTVTSRGGNGGVLVWTGANLTVENSTIADNVIADDLSADVRGAALRVHNGTVSLSSVTIAGNVNTAASGGAGGVFIEDDVPAVVGITATNSIIAGNSDKDGPANCGAVTAVAGRLDLLGAGVLGVDCGATSGDGITVTDDPKLDTLRESPMVDGDGVTWIRPLSVTSPALDAGETALTVDQRGVARPQGSAADVGAVEMRPAALGVALVGPDEPVAVGAKATLRAVARNRGDFPTSASTFALTLPSTMLRFGTALDGASCSASAEGARCALGVLQGDEELPIGITADALAAGSAEAVAALSATGLATARATATVGIVGGSGGGSGVATGVCVRTTVRPRAGSPRRARLTCRITLHRVGAYAIRVPKPSGSWKIAAGSRVAGTKLRTPKARVTTKNERVDRRIVVKLLVPRGARWAPVVITLTDASGRRTTTRIG